LYKNKTFLAVVPARSGSKRLPKKNILSLCGKPLISWSIDAAIKSRYLDKIVVTSDDDMILDIANKHGVHAIKRPDELASDSATSYDVVKHTLDNLESYDYVALLQPTSPLRNETHIDDAIEYMEEKKANAVISVCETDHSPMWSNTLDSSLSLKDFIKNEFLNKRSQDLDKNYKLNGAIYICKTDSLIKEQGFFLEDNIYAFIMDRLSSVDIDQDIDFKIAKALMESISD
tara:strand:+ start:2015 stop:2707 length:693 start_codon:yes stop_codon:yes gene_type:complete